MATPVGQFVALRIFLLEQMLRDTQNQIMDVLQPNRDPTTEHSQCMLI